MKKSCKYGENGSFWLFFPFFFVRCSASGAYISDIVLLGTCSTAYTFRTELLMKRSESKRTQTDAVLMCAPVFKMWTSADV